jgi:hypothetical protein
MREGQRRGGIMKLSAVVQKVIRLGDASRAYWDRELPRHHPHYPVIGAGEKSAPAPSEDVKIKALLTRLPESQMYTLMLLAYVGRGDFRLGNLLPARQRIRQTFPTRDLAIAQLTGEIRGQVHYF